jgi:hypothetical protein
MTTESKKEHRFKSVLEAKAPEHVRAIGLITIEVTNLEHALGTLLAAIIDAPEDFGHIIYLTPKAAIARLEILENLSEYLLVKDSKLGNLLQATTKRAKSIIGKRHRIVHGCWGITGGVVSVYSLPAKETETPEPYTVEQLQRVVTDIRDLVEEVAELIKSLRIYHHSVRKKAAEQGNNEMAHKPSWRAE